MKKLSHILLALGAILIASTPASASTAQFGNITGLFAAGNGAVMFYSDGSRDARPACATLTTRWAIDASTVAGQGEIAVMLNAYNRGKQLYVAGTGTCSIWGDTETVLFLQAQD